MLVEIGIVIASILPVMLLGRIIAGSITSWRWSIPIVQTIVAAATAIVLSVVLPTLNMTIVLVPMLLYPFLINIAAVANQAIQKKRALDGSYGEETRWAAELVEEGDQEFAIAVNALPQSELRDLGIIAESKEELRNLTIERLDELTNEPLPEDFA